MIHSRAHGAGAGSVPEPPRMGLQGSEVPGPAQAQHRRGVSSIHPGEQKKGGFFLVSGKEQKGLIYFH